LKTLSAAIAPSGREGAVAALIEKELAPLCDEIYTDRGGNLIAKIKPENVEAPKKIIISAHMDEVGFMVKTIDGDGRIRITPLGKYDLSGIFTSQSGK
jgi:endoglucanase